MYIRKRIVLFSLLGFALTTVSCKKYLDINKNPNVVTNPTVTVLLPTSQTFVASAMGVDMEVTGSIWGQYWTQSTAASQYRQLEQYNPSATTFETPWDNLYLGAENSKQLYELAGQQKQTQYQAISLLMRAYIFQVLTDAWGDVPYTDALKGLPKDGGIVNPHYDAQVNIYDSLIKVVDQGIALIDLAATNAPGSDDLVYGGDMSKWMKFGNTLKLKMALRIVYKNPGRAADILATLPVMGGGAYIDEGDDAQISFIATSGNKNPLFSEITGLGGTQNIVGSKTAIDNFNNEDDYRGFIFYEYVPAAGVPVGLLQGDYNNTTPITALSQPTPYVGADPNAADAGNDYHFPSSNAPVKFITSYESKFLQAEAALRMGTGNDADLYIQGIHANFYAYSFAFDAENLLLADTPDVAQQVYMTTDFAYYSYFNGDTLFGAPPSQWSVYPTTGSLNDKLKFIITQKWFSMCGNQGFEAWTEWRRTGYPDFFVLSKNNLTGQFPERLTYPNSEITTNLNFPGIQPVSSKVWWDVN